MMSFISCMSSRNLIISIQNVILKHALTSFSKPVRDAFGDCISN